MKTIPVLFAFAAAAAVASCGGAAPGGSDGASVETEGRRLSGPLEAEAQAARSAACMERMAHYRDLGVWKHGGAKPGVARAAWDMLKPAEKDEVFAIAACIAAGGQTGERIVTVAEEGNGPEIETRRVANDRDFAGAGTPASP
ncbi:MAG: hypothetical protein ACK4UL_07525 [Novosphingobium meiothermophilum]|uniref:hypothetical protein n=1 Tax=Novosphingobium TaxID=165696 RepID=UPI000D6E65E6|nr:MULTISPECIES: hypothetical protein [Novosphingobium]